MNSTRLALTFDISWGAGFTSKVDGDQADGDTGHEHKQKYQELLQAAHFFLQRHARVHPNVR